ncbi:uncharacterized protein LOC122379609 [Amphibalanus amphitrite]|uniref:uncharacterized protein LOC122379609 n=2 Tax=Amphibalanus amphitrite TaxID=1232801 RepID=UPI001C92529B|nr:uncharacterized protein LOC122379609 [Amphibalanus amphitrite]
MAVNGSRLPSSGVTEVAVQLKSGGPAVTLSAVVVPDKPLGVDMLVGMTGIAALGGVTVRAADDVVFGASERPDVAVPGPGGVPPRCSAVTPPALTVEERDFTVTYDAKSQHWTVAWKWRNGAEPGCLRNGVPQYGVPAEARQEFDAELRTWIDNGWLEPYDETVDGPPRGLIPLMAVEQQNKTKVRPVLDCRELNSHVEAHTADADVCADTLRKWRRHGANVAVVDLKRAYLQLRTDRRLWPFQTVVIDGQRYALTRVGFGLNVAPLIMKAVVRTVLQQDPVMQGAVIPYVDDLCVNEDVVSAERVIAHFASYGLQCKPPERAADGARLLGLRVEPVGGGLAWRRDNPVGSPPAAMTRRSVFSWCGRIVAHLPVCGWLRPATAWLKRRVNSLTRGWDDVTHDAALREQLKHVAERLASEDPARGQWCVTGHRAVLWTDASSIAAGVVLESEGGDVIEDACWLRRDEATHINMAELDAAVRGINLALAWDMKTIELKTDSATVHRWVSDALSGRARLRTKAHGEMLIRRRVDVIRQLVAELGISLTVSLVRSSQNRSDTLTRVPSLWLRQDSQPADQRPSDGQPVAAAAVVGSEVGDGGGAVTVDFRQAVTDVHVRAGHPGVRRTLYFARRDVSSSISRKVVREVVTACDVCRAVDPAPVTWRHGSLAVEGTWDRLAIDVTHYGGQSYLSVIDCGPSRFCVWRLLRRSDAATVTSELEQVFAERGAPAELLADNDTAFRSRQFAAFAARWGVLLRFRAVHRPSGNSIVERNHRSVKVIAARKKCGIGEAVHLYNITPRDGGTAAEAPANGIYRYPVRDAVRQRATAGASEEAVIGRPPARREGDFQVGDAVWVRRPGTRCTERSVRGTVSGVVSPQVVEVGGVPWHIRDLRHCGDTGGLAAGPRTLDRGSGGPQEAEEDRAGSPVVMTFGYEGDGAPGRPVEEADDAGGHAEWAAEEDPDPVDLLLRKAQQLGAGVFLDDDLDELLDVQSLAEDKREAETTTPAAQLLCYCACY